MIFAIDTASTTHSNTSKPKKIRKRIMTTMKNAALAIVTMRMSFFCSMTAP
jgi:hypothetical protein